MKSRFRFRFLWNILRFRLCADSRRNDLLRDIEYCSDLVIHFPYSQNVAWAFIEHFLLDRSYRYHINFGNFQTVDWPRETHKSQTPDPFDYKRASYEDRYALQILISMGYVFRDKWAQLTDQELKWNTCDPKERYSLCRFVAQQLCADHGYDLTRALEHYNAKKKEWKKAESANEEEAMIGQNKRSLKVAACTLTPMRTIFQPLEETVGSRALRHPEYVHSYSNIFIKDLYLVLVDLKAFFSFIFVRNTMIV